MKEVLFLEVKMNTVIETANENKIATLREICDDIKKKTGPLAKMSEEEKNERLAKIIAKLKSGKRLSEEELAFLRCVDRNMYAHALRVQKMAESMKNQLKHAKSKEDANRIISQAMSGISENDPDREYMVAAVNRVASDFHKSKQYNALPATEDEAGKKHRTVDRELFKQDEDNSFDPDNWSPIHEVLENMPSFEAVG